MLFSSGMNPHSLARFLQEIKYHTFDLERLAYFRSFLRDGQAAGAGAGAGAGGGGNSGKQGKKKKKKKGGGRGGGKKAFGAGSAGVQQTFQHDGTFVGKPVPVTAETAGICGIAHFFRER